MACRSILVVEDDAELRAALFDVLTDEGYAVECAADAKQALEVLDRRTVDIVLLDLIMPSIPAAELVARLDGAAPKVLVLTGMAEPPAFPHARFLRKPISRDTLLDSIRSTSLRAS